MKQVKKKRLLKKALKIGLIAKALKPSKKIIPIPFPLPLPFPLPIIKKTHSHSNYHHHHHSWSPVFMENESWGGWR